MASHKKTALKHTGVHSESAVKVSFGKKSLLYIVLLVIVIGVIVYVSSQPKVAATVNGQKIYASHVDALYQGLPAGYSLTKTQILQQLIDNKIILTYAQTRGFVLSDSDFNAILNNELNTTNMTLQDLQQQLAKTGSTLDDVRDSIALDLFVKKYIDPSINITYAQIAKYRATTNSTASDQNVALAILNLYRQQVLSQIISTYEPTMKVIVSKDYSQP